MSAIRFLPRFKPERDSNIATHKPRPELPPPLGDDQRDLDDDIEQREPRYPVSRRHAQEFCSHVSGGRAEFHRLTSGLVSLMDGITHARPCLIVMTGNAPTSSFFMWYGAAG